ncbi:MAG: S41 family peptidase, partial [Bacteroidia bacterium]
MYFKLACGNSIIKLYSRLIIFLLILVTQVNSTAARGFDTQELATVCKIWGFLKYHHPLVAKGKLNWDTEFIKIASDNQVNEFNSTMITWIKSLGGLNKSYSVAINKLNDNESLNWINADTLIDDSLRNILWLVYHHRIHSSAYYVKPFFVNGTVLFKNEKVYEDMDYSNLSMRLLAVSRYWNAINYFYPYLKLMDSDWNSILPLAIDKMKAVYTLEEYINTLRWMVKQTCDGHNLFYALYSFKRDSLKWAPYTYKIYEGKIWVEGCYADKSDLYNKLQVGDEIVGVNNQTATEHINYWQFYLNASNTSGLLNHVSYYALCGYDSMLNVKVKRADTFFDVTIKRFKEEQIIKLKQSIKQTKDTLINTVPYLNLAHVSKKEITQFLKRHFNAKAVIVDLRNYPKADPKVVFAKYLLSERTKFADIRLMDVYNPGRFRRMKKDSSIWDYSWIGSRNKNTYKGKVILLVDASTISHAEFTAMAMQVMPQVTVIGSQTGGANGNVTTLELPGNFITTMSGMGVWYPDATQSQRKGIRI